MREAIGEIRCPFHDVDLDGETTRERTADVRRDKNGKLYMYCEDCGPVLVHGRSFQAWIINNARLYSAKELPSHARENPRRESRLQGQDDRR